jgi:transcriptional regulator with XRE-family HTH domain
MGSRAGNARLGRNMKALRESRGITIGQACAAVDCRPRSLECWESGVKSFPPTTLVKLCDLYGYRDIYKMITEEIRFGFNPTRQQINQN